MSISLADIQATFHSIKISDGTDTLAIDGSGNIGVTDAGGSLTVDANNLDIRDLVFATDKVDATGSSVELGATTLAALESITVQNPSGAGAVNIQDGGNSITVDGTVAISGTVAVTQSTSPWVVSGSVSTTPSSFDTWTTLNHAITAVASQLDAVPLSGRLRLTIYNKGDKDVFIGPDNTVTAVTGTPVPKGGSYTEDLDDGAQVWALTASGTATVVLSEYAA